MVEEQHIGSGLWLQLGLNSAQSQLQGPNNAVWEISRWCCVNNAWEVQRHLGDVSTQPWGARQCNPGREGGTQLGVLLPH